jgi:hypothetical protein
LLKALGKILKEFDQNQGMHAIFVSKKMLEGDPKFEKSLLEKAQKQQDLVVMSYIAVAVLNDNVASIFTEIFFECVTENHITGHFGVASYKILHFIFINKNKFQYKPTNTS